MSDLDDIEFPEDIENPEEELRKINRVIVQYALVLRSTSDLSQQDRAKQKLATLRAYKKKLLQVYDLENDENTKPASSNVDTKQSRKYLSEILKHRDNRKIVLVTSAFHMPRSVRFYREAGFDVVGLDLNQSMIDVAESQRASHPKPVSDQVRFVRGDMLNFDLGRRFSLIYITFRSFQAMVTPEDQKCCLENIWRHLEPGGRLVVDVFDPRLNMCDPGYKEPGEARCVRNPASGHEVCIKTLERHNDPVNQRLTELWRFQELDAAGNTVREEYERLVLRWTYRYEMRYLLELCGFEVLAEYSDFQKSPPVYGMEQVWVAQRPTDSA